VQLHDVVRSSLLNDSRSDGLRIGDRVSYAVSSGFCTQVYHGKIIDFLAVVGNSDAFVAFDTGGCDWIEAKYLTAETA
jgi:hypothetical protein